MIDPALLDLARCLLPAGWQFEVTGKVVKRTVPPIQGTLPIADSR